MPYSDPEKKRKWMREFHVKNPRYRSVIARQWRQDNPIKMRNSRRRYMAQNPGLDAEYSKKYRERKKAGLLWWQQEIR